MPEPQPPTEADSPPDGTPLPDEGDLIAALACLGITVAGMRYDRRGDDPTIYVSIAGRLAEPATRSPLHDVARLWALFRFARPQDDPIDDPAAAELTVALDQLARSHGLLVRRAAGNPAGPLGGGVPSIQRRG